MINNKIEWIEFKQNNAQSMSGVYQVYMLSEQNIPKIVFTGSALNLAVRINQHIQYNPAFANKSFRFISIHHSLIEEIEKLVTEKYKS